MSAPTFDVLIWCKNAVKAVGYDLFRHVLKRVEEVIPNIHRKIAIDDYSEDKTRQLLRELRWEVYDNPSQGIASAFNEAFRIADCEFVISIEQDVILTKEWFKEVYRTLLSDEKIAVVQGLRLPIYCPSYMRKFEEYRFEWFKRHGIQIVSIDNNLYRREVINKLLPVPLELRKYGVDLYLYSRILEMGYRWITLEHLISGHIRKGGLWIELKRYYRYCRGAQKLDKYTLKTFKERKRKLEMSPLRLLLSVLASPISGLKLAIKLKELGIIVYYPLLRTIALYAYFHRQNTST